MLDMFILFYEIRKKEKKSISFVFVYLELPKKKTKCQIVQD
jgi:hypothetical protein